MFRHHTIVTQTIVYSHCGNEILIRGYSESNESSFTINLEWPSQLRAFEFAFSKTKPGPVVSALILVFWLVYQMLMILCLHLALAYPTLMTLCPFPAPIQCVFLSFGSLTWPWWHPTCILLSYSVCPHLLVCLPNADDALAMFYFQIVGVPVFWLVYLVLKGALAVSCSQSVHVLILWFAYPMLMTWHEPVCSISRLSTSKFFLWFFKNRYLIVWLPFQSTRKRADRDK